MLTQVSIRYKQSDPAVMLTQVSISTFCWKGTADPDLRQGDILVPTVMLTKVSIGYKHSDPAVMLTQVSIGYKHSDPAVMLTQVSIGIFCWKGTADPDLRPGDDWVTSSG